MNGWKTSKTNRLLFWVVALGILLLGTTQILSATLRTDSNTPLIINEFITSNGTGLTDEDGDHSDWIEIYNRSKAAINLAGWAISDDPAQPEKWGFPDMSLDSGEYLVIFASGKDRRAPGVEERLHTNFQLSKKGEFLGLYRVLDGQWMDVISPGYPEQFQDISYGRYGSNLAYGYFNRPTPAQANDERQGWVGLIDRVAFSGAQRGFYDAPVKVQLKTNTPGATIYYTTDGSRPGETNGAVYTKPIQVSQTTLLRAIAVKPGYFSPYVDTHTYIFLDDVLAQSAAPPGFPPFDYAMDPEIVNHPDYRDTIKDDLKSIPTLSLVTATENYDIYAYPRERGEAWERPVSVELIYPDTPDRGFQIDAGLRIQGGFGRWEVIPKHSFRLFFNGKYGATKLEYPLFPDSPVESFDTLVLRGGVNRSYAGKSSGKWEDHRLTTYTRDEWLRASQIAMSGVGSHGIFVHLYLNGMYWGLYNVVERPDASFMAAYLGGEKEDWYAINHSGLISGPDDRIESLLHQLTSLGELEVGERYAAIESYVDVDQFIDTVILNFYAGNEDWSDSNWYVGFHHPSGRLKFFVWDGEMIWLEGARIFFVNSLAPNRINLFEPAFTALIENDDFRMKFADRLYKHLFNDGPLTDANTQARWLDINHPINRAIVGESARWGDARYETPITRQDWLNAQDKVLAQMDGNAAKLVELARHRGYYPEIDPPNFNHTAEMLKTGAELSTTTTTVTGQIYYTTDGSDPRMPGSGSVAPGAIIYRSPIVLTGTTHIKARVLAGKTWSALNETTFSVVEQDRQLHLTEIMYNPVGGNNYEFVELKNTGEADIDLSNMYFEGINFTFPPHTPRLAPSEVTVLVNNPTAFAQRYPNIRIGGNYNGRLANAGETIALKDPAGNTVVSVEYDDEQGWPLSPDGRGDSLVLVNFDGDPNNGKNWRASTNPNGSPGTDDPVLVQLK